MAKRTVRKRKSPPESLPESLPERLSEGLPESGDINEQVQSEAEAADVAVSSTSVRLLFFPRDEWERDWKDANVRVLRQMEDSQKWILQGTMAWDVAGQDAVTEAFGGGRYLVQLVGADDRGVRGIRKSQVYRFPGAYKPPQQIKNTAGAPAGIGVQPTQRIGTMGDGGAGDVSPSQALNVALVDSVIGLMKTMKEAPPPRGMDWGPILAAVMPVLGTVLTKLLDGKKDEPMLRQMQALQDEMAKLRDRPGPAANAITDALAGIERIVKVSSSIRDMSATPEGETSIWGALGKEALSLLANAQRNQHQPQGAPTAALPAPGVPTPVSTAPLWQQLLMSQRARLLDAASRGLDADMVADFAINFLPEQYVGVMTEFLQRPDAATVMQQVIPDLTNFPLWTDNLIVAMRAAMFGGDQGDTEEVRVTG